VTRANNEASADEIVQQLLEPGADPFLPESTDQLLALAWSLKEHCYAAWSSEPQHAAHVAHVLQDLVQRYLQRIELAEQPERELAVMAAVQAIKDWTLGIAHLTRGEMDPAVHSLDEASAAFRQIGQADHAAQTQVPKIMALSMLGRYPDAVECACQARAVFTEFGDARSAGKVSLNLSALHERLGAYAEAVRESRSAAVLFARVGDNELSIMADINAGNALSALGDFDEALLVYARAQSRAKARDYPVLEALADEALALLKLARGDYRSALAGLERSRQCYEHLGMPQQLATAEKQLGDAYLELRLLPEASALFEQAVDRFRELRFPDEQAWALIQLGRVQALSEDYPGAHCSLQRASELFAQQGLKVGEASVDLARAELLLLTGEHAQVSALANSAAEGFESAGLIEGGVRADLVKAQALLDAGDIDGAMGLFASTLERATELQLLTTQVQCLAGRGLATRAAGDKSAARPILNEAIELFEDQRRALPGDDLRTAFLSDYTRPYQALLSMAVEEHEEKPCSETAAAVLVQLDRVRARSLGERLAHHSHRGESVQSQKLRERLFWLYREVRRIEEEGDSTPALIEERRAVERELLEQARRSRMVEHDYRAAHPSATQTIESDLNIRALQDSMDSGDALVAYGVIDDELFACVLTPDDVSVHRKLAAWSEVLDVLSTVRFQIDSLAHGAAGMRDHMETLTRRAEISLQQLHALVWSPIGTALAGCQRVILVPHDQLAWLPFGALHDGSVALAEKVELAVVPSARLALRGYQRQPIASNTLMVLGETRHLPYAAREAESLGSLFDEARVLLDKEATMSALQRHAGDVDVLHMACHAQFRTDNPMFSALHLSDSPLTAELAENLRLRPGLVVLSACETGVAEVGFGDEMIGLVRAFLVAGTSRVLAAAWPIDDEYTAGFMVSFYRARRSGKAVSAALRDAQLETRRRCPHPFYWAAFSLYGGF
jgi:CHAT domain-containing protein